MAAQPSTAPTSASIRPLTFAHERTLPVDPVLAPVVGSGLVRGQTVVCAGPASMSCAIALLIAPTQHGSWAAVVGVPSFGVLAAADMGVALERTVFVDDPHRVGVDPANVLGYTKRIAERVTADAARRTGRTYVSVRFGNVIGSRGSALETFQRQINEGGPVTVTHPDMTRYFMAVREAVRLTMQAATIGRSGEVLVLDMGTPMSVLEVARQLIDRSGKDVDIIFTGIRPGEKMHETLISHGETADRPFHPMIDHVDVTPLAITEGLDACASVGLSAHSIAGLEFMAGCDATVPTDNINRAGTTAPRAVPLRRDS